MRYKSCRLLEHGLYIYLDPGSKQLCVGHCCNSDNLELEDRLYLYFDLKNESLSWDYVFAEKRKLRENAKKGIYPSQCEGCFELTENNWDDEDYISHITFGHIMKCNSRCIYCPIGRIPDCHNREQDVDIKPVIEELTKKNLLRYDGSLRFVGGEPTLMKEFDWLVDLFSAHNVPEIYVPTSGIRLSKSLCKALEKVESAAIVASVDAGNRETFEKIKGTKFYDIVIKNMTTYLKHAGEKNFIIQKFILLTNYNDTAQEVEQWLKKCHKAGFIEVQFDSEHSVSSSEHCENKKYVNRTLKMLQYTQRLAVKYNLKVTSFLAFMNRAKRIYDNQLQFYNANIDKYKDLFIDNQTADGYYKDIYLNIDKFPIEVIEKKVDTIVKEERFSPLRKAYITADGEITNSENFEKYAMMLLRLGFDIVLTTSSLKYNKTIEEILKTSNSDITFDLSGKFIKILAENKIKKHYGQIYKVGNIHFLPVKK